MLCAAHRVVPECVLDVCGVLVPHAGDDLGVVVAVAVASLAIGELDGHNRNI